MAENSVQDDTDAMIFGFFAQTREFFFRSKERINFFVITRIVMVVAAAFKNRIQIKAGYPHICEIIQFFPDSLQGAAKKIIVSNFPGVRIFYVAGNIIPVSVKQCIRFAAELGQWYIAPVKTVRENLIDNGVFQPVRRFRRLVVHRDLEGRRFFFVQLAPATQLFHVVSVIICFFRCFNFEIIPEQAAFVRNGKSAMIHSFFSWDNRCIPCCSKRY